MCGIVGFNHIDDKLRDLTGLLEHRGPDGEGFYENTVAFGHRRLKIIGDAPQPLTDKKYTIVYNGAIYNHKELKKKLKHDWKFKTDSDTEVVLAAYVNYGSYCVNELDGMFAFAIYDPYMNRIFLTRDHAGIKPLFYYHVGDKFAFASSIDVLLKTLVTQPNEKTIYDFLTYDLHNPKDTFYKHIYSVPAGHYGYYELGSNKLTFSRYWENKFYNDFDGDYEEAVETLRNLICVAVRRQFKEADVSVGTCLSGGIDSSIVTSLLKSQTFSAVFPGEDIDESKYVDVVNKHGFRTTPSWQGFEKIDGIRRPINSGSYFAQNAVFDLASGHVAVTLDGQGADELFGGYRHMHDWKLRFNNRNYYKMRSIANYNIQSQIAIPRTLRDQIIFELDCKLPMLLYFEDWNSMAYSIESRVPFLDRELMKFVFTLPEKFFKPRKKILKDAFRGIVPDFVLNRNDKIGFEVPNSWDIHAQEFLDSWNSLKCLDYVNLNIRNSKDLWKIASLEAWLRKLI
jgi:asparagine synthase (glutamine-hydrolysing)